MFHESILNEILQELSERVSDLFYQNYGYNFSDEDLNFKFEEGEVVEINTLDGTNLYTKY